MAHWGSTWPSKDANISDSTLPTPGGTTLVMLYNARAFRQLVKAPLVGAIRFLLKPLSWHRLRSERLRAMYDQSLAGDAAPHTDFTSPRDAKTLFAKFSRVAVAQENADPMFRVIPRK